MKSMQLVTLLAAVWAFVPGKAAWAVFDPSIAIYDETIGAGMSPHGSSEFLLSDFAAPNAVTRSATSTVFDVVPTINPSSIFGIAAQFYEPLIDFDPAEAQWEIRLRVLPANQATSFTLNYEDIDDPMQLGEVWAFNFDISSLTFADGWTTLRQGFGSPISGEQPTAFPQDIIQNPGLHILFVSGFGPERLNIEVDYARVRLVPEPNCAAFVAPFLLAIVRRRGTRRRSGQGGGRCDKD